MRVGEKHFRTLWPAGGNTVEIIDQTLLPHAFAVRTLATGADAEEAIRVMRVRGAPLIGAAAAYGVALFLNERTDDAFLAEALRRLEATRPTAVNLRWALRRMQAVLDTLPPDQRRAAAWTEAARICDEDVAVNEALGTHGAALLHDLAAVRRRRINVLTHCNAGWLATVDWGTALSVVYKAAAAGVDLHVWVDETRPRNQGASLTAWELGEQGIPYTLIADNTGGHLMQHGQVDCVIVGADRVTRRGDVCNKIGTYLKALAARDNGVPFYAAVPGSTIDWELDDGVAEIPIEERGADEVLYMSGAADDGRIARVRVAPQGAAAANFGFDVTPARLVTGIITERGVSAADPAALRELFAKDPA